MLKMTTTFGAGVYAIVVKNSEDVLVAAEFATATAPSMLEVTALLQTLFQEVKKSASDA